MAVAMVVAVVALVEVVVVVHQGFGTESGHFERISAGENEMSL